MCFKGNTPPLLVVGQSSPIALKTVWQFLRKCVDNPTQDTEIPVLCISTKDAKSYYKAMCLVIFIAVLSIITRTWKHPRCPSTEEQIRKYGTFTEWTITQWLNNNGKWMDLENIILSKVTQMQKGKYSMSSLISDL